MYRRIPRLSRQPPKRSGPGFQQARNRGRTPMPVRRFSVELFPAGACEGIELRAAGVWRLPPFRIEPAGALETLQGGEERSGIHFEHAARDLLDAARDAEAVHRLEAEGLQDQHVQGALDHVGILVVHKADDSAATS